LGCFAWSAKKFAKKSMRREKEKGAAETIGKGNAENCGKHKFRIKVIGKKKDAEEGSCRKGVKKRKVKDAGQP